jgi:hypothetical protein
MKTTVCYVISPGWELYVYVSLHSLVESGSTVDSVKILSVGGHVKFLKSIKLPVDVEVVPELCDDYFLLHKTLVTSVDTSRLVFLDADTVALNPIDELWTKCEADFIARPATVYESKDFDQDAWKDLLSVYNARLGPYFNSGFFIFQNRTHQVIGESWRFICEGLLTKDPDPVASIHGPGRQFTEQMSLSIGVLQSGIKYTEMPPRAHMFGWSSSPSSPEAYRGATVYHTGSRAFMKYVAQIERNGDLDLSSPLISASYHPLFLQLQAYRAGYHVKSKLQSGRS